MKFILCGDTDRNEIIVDVEDGSAGDDWPVGPDAENPSTVPERVEYDSNDRFDVQGPSDTAPRPVRSIEDFEKALAEYLAATPAGDAQSLVMAGSDQEGVVSHPSVSENACSRLCIWREPPGGWWCQTGGRGRAPLAAGRGEAPAVGPGPPLGSWVGSGT